MRITMGMDHWMLAAVLLAALSCRSPSPPVAISRMEEVYRQASQGQLKAGVIWMKSMQPEALEPDDREQRACLLERFGEPTEPMLPSDWEHDQPFVRDVAQTYFHYWWRGLMDKATSAANENQLLAELESCMIRYGHPVEHLHNLDAMTEALGPLLEAQGVHSLRGMTRPFWELMLWRSESTQRYAVQLLTGTQSVKVVFLSDFLMRGWLAFATCGHSSSGGWTTPDAIYCVKDSYDLESERFRVSLLAHEGQHFWDAHHGPKREQPELEYRAKLVEIIQAQASQYELLANFASSTSRDRKLPHAWANRRLIRGLSERIFADPDTGLRPGVWQTRNAESIRQAAMALLRESK